MDGAETDALRDVAAGQRDAACRVARAHDVLGGARCYSELQRVLAQISPRMLASRLRMLEARGLIARRLFPTAPPQTECSLTLLGAHMGPVIQATAEFGSKLRPSLASGTGGQVG